MNRMTDLLNKIERRLGTKPMNLPEDLRKDKWANSVIVPDTLTTFSRFFPYKMPVLVDNKCKKDGYYFIDTLVPEGTEILGVRANNYGLDDIALLQLRADCTSLFNNGIYLDFIPPNMLKLESVNGGDVSRGLAYFPIEILVKHRDNLMTIAPTKMETFERLAIADVAVFLFQYLKFFDGLETVFANVDLKMNYLETEANKREEVLDYLRNNYVNPANEAQPIMYTI